MVPIAGRQVLLSTGVKVGNPAGLDIRPDLLKSLHSGKTVITLLKCILLILPFRK